MLEDNILHFTKLVWTYTNAAADVFSLSNSTKMTAAAVAFGSVALPLAVVGVANLPSVKYNTLPSVEVAFNRLATQNPEDLPRLIEVDLESDTATIMVFLNAFHLMPVKINFGDQTIGFLDDRKFARGLTFSMKQVTFPLNDPRYAQIVRHAQAARNRAFAKAWPDPAPMFQTASLAP